MKHVELCLTAALAALLLLAACGGSDAPEVAVPTPVIGEPQPTPAPTTVQPTPEPEATVVPTAVELADDELIALATAAFDAAPQPPEIIAFDVSEAAVRDDGAVELVLCAWAGDTVFNEVRRVAYQVGSGAEGEPEAEYITGSTAVGDCLNEELMESVLAFSRDFDSFFAEALAEPDAFVGDPQVAEIFTGQGLEATVELLRTRAADEIQARGTSHASPLPESAVADILWRRYVENGIELFGVAVCRDMNAEYGFYRGDQLLDDGRTESSGGEHSITEYIFELQGDGWRLQQLTGRIWGDCFRTGDWLEAVNQWKPEPVGWQPWDR